jgi:hypothetical protein
MDMFAHKSVSIMLVGIATFLTGICLPCFSAANSLPDFAKWCEEFTEASEDKDDLYNSACIDAYEDDFGPSALAETKQERARIKANMEMQACILGSRTMCSASAQTELHRWELAAKIKSAVASEASLTNSAYKWIWNTVLKYPRTPTFCSGRPKSSFIEETCYLAPNGVVFVTIRGHTYAYCSISVDEYIALLTAPSLGRYYVKHIKPRLC